LFLPLPLILNFGGEASFDGTGTGFDGAGIGFGAGFGNSGSRPPVTLEAFGS
jgi:hypothetical protein